jgi:hypothetical protein
LSQGTAFGYLGHSCGGIQEQAFATGFDAGTGYPTGDVYMQTRCGGSGRGGGYHVTTYSAWAAVMWDFTGADLSDARLASAPTVDPAFTAYDANGNELYNQSNRAYLLLSPTFVPLARVTGISATTGPASGGTSVTISGTGFNNATAVDFGTAPASFTITSDTSIAAVSPATGAGTVDVTVTDAGGTSATSPADEFTFVAPPTVSSISPNSGPVAGGTEVTITGTNLSTTTGVKFGESPAGFVVIDDTSITAYAPAIEAPDDVHVIVTTIGGVSPTSNADRYTYTP